VYSFSLSGLAVNDLRTSGESRSILVELLYSLRHQVDLPVPLAPNRKKLSPVRCFKNRAANSILPPNSAFALPFFDKSIKANCARGKYLFFGEKPEMRSEHWKFSRRSAILVAGTGFDADFYNYFSSRSTLDSHWCKAGGLEASAGWN
jgi:hypothetical protein